MQFIKNKRSQAESGAVAALIGWALMLLGLLMPGLSGAESADRILVHAGNLIDRPGERPKTDQTLIVEDGRIVAIEAGFLREEGVEILDLSQKTVLPGLIDSHVHLTLEYGRNIRLARVQKNATDRVLDGAHHARLTLEAGFTSVQDVGGRYEIFALRDAINAGKLPGPRIRASGPAVSPTGGHGDLHGYAYDLLEVMRSPSLCDGPDDCRRAVRELVSAGADVIKITATGGVLSNTAAGTEQQFFDDEMRAIVETAAKMGRKVTAHAHGKAGIEAALRAGVHSIEHGSYLDADTLSLFKRKKATLVPTVLAGQTVVEWAKQPGWLPPASAKKALEVGPVMQNMASMAYRAGVNIAFGTDSGVSKHGENAREFRNMVDAGMSPAEAIRSATLIAARHLDMEEDVGTLEAGKYADLIAVADNPLDNIDALLDVHTVMKGGVIYKHRP